jgi:hypothetical protein
MRFISRKSWIPAFAGMTGAGAARNDAVTSSIEAASLALQGARPMKIVIHYCGS